MRATRIPTDRIGLALTERQAFAQAHYESGFVAPTLAARKIATFDRLTE